MKKNNFRGLLCTLSCIFLLLVSAAALHAAPYQQVVAFGDSLTDHNGLKTYEEFLPEPVPEAFTNCEGTPCVWLEYMAEALNLNLETDLVNNSIGGAKTEGHLDPDVQAAIDAEQLPPLGLLGQVNAYLGQSPEFNADQTLFVIWIGGNDLLAYLSDPTSAESAEALAQGAVTNIVTAMTQLAGAGATDFLVLTLPDLSRTPQFNQLSAKQRADVQSLTEGFNNALQVGLLGFEDGSPKTTVLTFDVFSYLTGVINKDVFENSTDSYLVLDEEGEPTGETNGEDPSDFLFYDSIHPTTRAHSLLGAEVAETVESGDTRTDDDDTCFIETLTAH